MTKHEIYQYYFNPIIENILVNTQLELNYLNEEFKLWLIENEFLNESDTSSNWYYNQKTHIINNINVSIKNMNDFVQRQNQKNLGKLNNYKEFILNVKRYPIKPQAIPEYCTNYKSALQRIDIPITKNLNGIDLNKIDSEESQDKNIWLKNYLIPVYKGGNFIQIAKNYYYGLDNGKKVKFNAQIMTEILQRAFQFCSLMSNRIQMCTTEGRSIINFINTDPNTAQVNKDSISDLQKIQMATKKNAMTDKAGTNPYQNIGQKPVNANTDYSIFEYEYFKDILTEDQQNIPTKQENIYNKPNQNISKLSNNLQQNVSKQQKEEPNGAPINSGSLAYRKKQIMCEIIKDCFNAKLSALGLLYRDFMYLMEQHVSSYKQQNNQNAKQQINQEKPAPNKQISNKQLQNQIQQINKLEKIIK